MIVVRERKKSAKRTPTIRWQNDWALYSLAGREKLREEYVRAVKLGKRCAQSLVGLFNRLSTFLLSMVLMLGIPVLPVAIEWVKTGSVKNDNYLITAAVWAASLGIAAEHDLYRASYAALFLATIVLYMLTIGGSVVTGVDRYSGYLLLAVVLGHSTERFWWHVVLSRPLTLSLKKVDGADDA